MAIKKSINMDVRLTDKEKEIFELLLSVVREKSPNTILRAAGGWVRDKLLGIDSHDIDIAVDNLSGLEFANKVLDWMHEHRLSIQKNVTFIEANTEAQKKVESANVNVLGIPIDFVQLRKETYTEDSRNPTVEVATVEEDARRRDLTINSLFYNINDGKIEDFVGGIEDLKNRKARTPINSLKTYLEDPLRILRAIRFAAKYDLELDPEIIIAAKDPSVVQSFKTKTKKERIMQELIGTKEGDGWKQGFLTGPNFDRAVELLNTLGLRDIIFKPTEEHLENAKNKEQYWQKGWAEDGGWDREQNNPHHTETVWNHTVKAIKYLKKIDESKLFKGKKLETKDKIVRNLAMLLHDIGKCDVCAIQSNEEGHSTYHGHARSSALIAEEILTSLKIPNDIKDRVIALIDNHMFLHTQPESTPAKTIRRLVRDLGRENAPLLVDISIADSMGKANSELNPKYERFGKIIYEYLSRKEVKPPINGREIMDLLGLKSGKEVGNIVKALGEELLQNPDMTREEAVGFVKKYHS